MEKVGSWDRGTVIGKLSHGREHANQLKSQLQLCNSSEAYKSLVEKLISSYDNALTLVNYMAVLESGNPSQIAGNMLESPISLENSPKSEGSDPDYKGQNHRDVFKKRKILPKWSKQVRVYSGTGLDGSLNDGYNWRKYGQKDILGTNHPRAYYRCTHRNTQGCLATKQVQRSDEDSSIFEVIYKGKHSCVQEMQKQNKQNFDARKKGEEKEEIPRNVQKMMISIEPGLIIETQEHDITESFPAFSFPSTPIDESNDMATHFFSDPVEGNNFIGSHSPPFISPATSESYFSLSPPRVNDFGIVNSLSSDSDFAEIVSNATPLAFGDLDLSFDQVDFDSNFFETFDNFD